METVMAAIIGTDTLWLAGSNTPVPLDEAYYIDSPDTEPPTPQPIDCSSCRATSVPPDHTCAAYLRHEVLVGRVLQALDIACYPSGDSERANRLAAKLNELTGFQMKPIDLYSNPQEARRALAAIAECLVGEIK